MEPQDGTESSEKMALWRRGFPTYPAFDWGNINDFTFDREQPI